MKKRIFGFDLGIASIGWAVVEFDNENFDEVTGEITEGKIVKSGVRCFPVAENPKDGSSLAKPRREKRLARRVCRRKARRMEGIKGLFVALGLATKEELDFENHNNIYANQIGGDVWNLRVKALSSELSKHELVRVLTHLAKHRGFKSYRKAQEESDAEGGKVLKAIKENKELLSENKTLAQVIVERAGTNGKKRNYTNKNPKEKEAIYINSIPREEIKRELDLIFNCQKESGIFTQKLYDDFCRISFRDRPISEVGDMVGYCRFEYLEKRAPKEAPSSELFVALGKINNLKIIENNEERFLTKDEKQKLLDLLKNTKEVKYSTISKKIFKGTDIKFSNINYSKTTKKDNKGNIKEINPEDEEFYSMKGWHKFKKAFNEEQWQYLCNDIPLFDKCVNVLACMKNDEAIEEGLKALGINQEFRNIFKKITTDKFLNLSFKALYKIIPYMFEGDIYNIACEKCGYDYKDCGEQLVTKKGILLEAISQEKLTTVPVVNRTIAQFRKVYNAMVRQYGEPDQINLEFARELKKSYEERKKIKQIQEQNQQERDDVRKELEEKNIKANSQNILKYRLYNQQHGKCIYSNEAIDINRLDENGYCDVDHILPYSKSLDNSFNNKVLCLASENRMKGNKTPYEYLKPQGKWEDFVVRVNTTLSLGRTKRANLLQTKSLERELDFRERNSNDNSHIANYIKRYLEDGVDFSNSKWNITNRIQTRNGALTDYLRHCWGLHKDRNENDRHHAQDAIVVACATQGMVQYLSTISSLFENKFHLMQQKGEAWYKSLKHKFEEPWMGFRTDVENSLKDIFVSRPPRKKASGEIHQETIRTLNPLFKNYNAKDVKSGIKIRGGLANNGEMLRTDVFMKKNKKGKNEFYLVPVYLSNMGKELPSKAIVPLKYEEEWIEITDNFTFMFSLFMDDLVKVKKGDKEIFGYFKGTGRTTGSITIETHDRSEIIPSIGVKTQDNIQKYQVSPLGDISEVKSEKRMPLK